MRSPCISLALSKMKINGFEEKIDIFTFYSLWNIYIYQYKFYRLQLQDNASGFMGLSVGGPRKGIVQEARQLRRTHLQGAAGLRRGVVRRGGGALGLAEVEGFFHEGMRKAR